jgi:alkanesulfonate monooxygenase SsuD/methylene tetrahydromethanopterin reductase-like flavin-dependent oxidoreductase (luciferase family)
MRVLWTDPEPSFSGRFVAFSGVCQRPPPVQRPHPPIVIGGHSAAAYRRAVTTADGWYGVYLDPGQAELALSELRQVAAGCQRPARLGDLEITITPPGRVDAATARQYADIGVHRLVLQPVTEDGSDMEDLIESAGQRLVGRV